MEHGSSVRWLGGEGHPTRLQDNCQPVFVSNCRFGIIELADACGIFCLFVGHHNPFVEAPFKIADRIDDSRKPRNISKNIRRSEPALPKMFAFYTG